MAHKSSGPVLTASLLMMMVILLHVGCVPQKSQPEPKYAIMPPSIDFGCVIPSVENVRELLVRNTGNVELILDAPKSTCPCIHSALQTKCIAPGKTAPLKIWLELQQHRDSKVTGSVLIGAKNLPSAITEIAVTGQIRPEYVIEPPLLDFGKIKRARGSSATFLLHQNGPREVSLYEVKCPAGVDATIHEMPSMPSGNPHASENWRHYEIVVTIQANLKARFLADELIVRTNVERSPERAVPLRAEITGIECGIEPKVAVFGATAPRAHLCTLKLSGGSDLLLKGVYSNIDGMMADSVACGSGLWDIRLQLKADVPGGPKAGTLQIELEEEGLLETRSIPIYGTAGPPATR